MKRIILLSIVILSAFASNAQCSADFTWSANGTNVQFTNASSGTYYYNWYFGDGSSSSTAINPNHTYASPGTYDVCLYAIYQDSVGGFCGDTTCYQITVQDSTIGNPCSVDFTWTVSGNTVFFNNTSTGTNMNSWSFGDGGSSSATNPTYTYSSPGTYWVCLYSYYNDSLQITCADSTCYQITVMDSTIGNPCSVDFTWTVSGNTVFFNNTSTGTNMNDWSFGDGGNSTATNPTYTYSSPGTYWVCLYSYYNDSLQITCADSICYQITVMDSIGGSGCMTGANVYANGLEIVGTNTSVGASQYSWSVSDYNTGASLTTSNSTNLSYYPNYYGTFWVCLTAYDSTGAACDTSICSTVTINDSLDTTASVGALSFTKFLLYPNPTNAVLNVQLDNLSNDTHARIVDLVGREMIHADLTSHITEIPVHDLPGGIYMIQLVNAENQIIGMKKFIRE